MPARSLIQMTCNGKTQITEGIAVCEAKNPQDPKVSLKIMPVPGRVVYSDGLTKKTEDFNWRKGGWIWKHEIIDTTWVELDLGELNSIFGDVPIATDVQGMTDTGVINNRGIIYTRICNDKDVPCSRLIVKYDCAGKIENTYTGQIGKCSRMSGSSQKFAIPVSTPDYKLKAGAMIRVRSGRTGWEYKHDISAEEVSAGESKFIYPSVSAGPDLITITVFQWEQGILVEYHSYVLISGYSPSWTGIDRPHAFPSSGGLEFCTPFTADLMEVVEGNQIKSITKECSTWNTPQRQICAFAYDRESGDVTYTCIKNGKEVRW